MVWQRWETKTLKHRRRMSWLGLLLGTAAVVAFSPWARKQLKKALVVTGVGAIALNDRAQKWTRQVKDGLAKLKEMRAASGKEPAREHAGISTKEKQAWKAGEEDMADPETPPEE